MTDDICQICNKKVKDQDYALSCDGCDAWYHIGCHKVAMELYIALQKCKEELWFCRNCKIKVKGCVEKIKTLEKQNAEQQQRIDNLELKWEKLKEEIVEETKNEIKRELNSGKLTETMAKEVASHNEEREDRRKRKNNLVLYNAPESNNEESKEREKEDMSLCKDIFQKSVQVNGFKIIKTIRLGKRNPNGNNKPRPLLVKMNSENEKWLVLKNAKNLKYETNAVRKKIGITKDLTKQE